MGDKLVVVIGQQGSSGGHGASFVQCNDELLLVAGGGGRGVVKDYEKKWMKKMKCLRGEGASFETCGKVDFDRLTPAQSLSSTASGGIAENSNVHYGGFGGGGYAGGGGGYVGGRARFGWAERGSSFTKSGEFLQVENTSESEGCLVLRRI